MGNTTIWITDKLWKELDRMKKQRGDTFEDIIWDLIKSKKETNQK